MAEYVLKPGEVLSVRCGACSEGGSGNNNKGSALGFLGLGGKRNTRKAGNEGNKTRKAQEGGKKKRGPNGYMKFAAEQRPKILKENPDMRSNVVAVARKIGEAWRALPESERKKY